MKKLLALITLGAPVFFAASAFAEGEMASGGMGSDSGLKYLAAAIAISVSALGGALGQGRTAAAALEGIARNPQAKGDIFVPMIIGLALIESLVLYGFVIAFLILG